MSRINGTRLVCSIAFLLIACSPVFAGFRTLSWDPSVGATGYRVYYGESSRDYSASLDVGNTTIVTLDADLDDCTRWFFAVTAYNSAGESEYSEEVEWLTPMAVDSARKDGADLPIVQGDQFDLWISGVGFQPGAVIEIEHPDWECPAGADPGACQAWLDVLRATVTVGSPQIDGCHAARVYVGVEPAASGGMPAMIGNYKVTVTNTDQTSITNDQVFTVLTNPARFDVNRSTDFTTDRVEGADLVSIKKFLEEQDAGICAAVPGTAATPCSEQRVSEYYTPDLDFDGDGWIDGNELAGIIAFQGWCWDEDAFAWKTSACQ